MYNGYMDFPFVCSVCHETNMVDLDNLETRQVDRVLRARGYTCTCGSWYPLFVTNSLLDQALLKLERRRIDRKYPYHFSKALRHALDIRERTGI